MRLRQALSGLMIAAGLVLALLALLTPSPDDMVEQAEYLWFRR